MSNPASLSPSLAELFPPGVVAAELRESGDPALLFPEETALLGRAVEKRVREFAAGRLCARRALAELGVVGFPLRAAADRQPVWPTACVGSISHTDGYCAAVVAERSLIAGLGVDCEVVGRVTSELWGQICIPAEVAWLESMGEVDRAIAATLLFAAKEAFYKCQYPLTGEWLNFEDLHMTLSALDRHGGAFALTPTRPLAAFALRAGPAAGRYRVHEGLISVGVALIETQ